MTEFKLIPLADIRPDENQPRKFYDETAMQELTASIKEKGVIQPAVIRPAPDGKGYVVVVGERRYRGATAAGLTELPAVIRDMTDDEALELQIIENLQRKDVHPMEEAVAFKSLVERKEKPLTVEEIAARIGKTVRFVIQRLKLNALTKIWQDAYFKNLLSAVDAIKIAAIEEKQQEAIAKDCHLKDTVESGQFIEITDYYFRQYSGDLKQAPFDTTDPTLSPLGACTSCPFNSAVAALFPEDEKHPRCNNVADYRLKSAEAFTRNIAAAMEDPAIALINTGWGYDEKEIKAFEKKGHKVYGRHDYNEVGKGAKDFDAKLAAGKYLKALVVIGNDKGRFLHIELTPKKSTAKASAVKDKEKSGKLTATDIDAEIIRLKDRNKRSIELDGEKVWSSVRSLIPKNYKTVTPESPLTQDEKDALADAMQNKFDFRNTIWTSKLEVKGDVKKISDGKLFSLMRAFILDVLAGTYGSHLREYSGNWRAYKLIKAYMPADVKTLEIDQEGIAMRRKEKFDARVASLQEQKKDLKPAAATKKSEPAKKQKKVSTPPQKKHKLKSN